MESQKSLLHPSNKEHRDHTADMAECIEDSSGLAAGRSGNEKAKAFKCLRHKLLCGGRERSESRTR